MHRSYTTIIILLTFLNSCKIADKSEQKERGNQRNEYALNFNIQEHKDGYKILSVIENWSGKEVIYDYALISDSSDITSYTNNYVIEIPPKRIVCMSTSHIAYITSLGMEESIIAVSGVNYISDSLINEHIKSGKIKDIGYESSLNYETLISLNPDVVFTYGITGENNIYIEKIKSLGIKVIAVGDYMENHPLGKAEYLKFFGAIFNCSDKADSTFESIKKDYSNIKTKALKSGEKVKVLLNAPWKDVWYIPGNDSYMSRLINDAGGIVLGSKGGEFYSYPNSVEEVFKLSYEADFWLNPNNYNTLEELKRSNPLFSKIEILKSGRVFNNTKRNTPTGGSDFWERGVVEPHIILKDLITIFNSKDSIPDNLKYYKILN